MRYIYNIYLSYIIYITYICDISITVGWVFFEQWTKLSFSIEGICRENENKEINNANPSPKTGFLKGAVVFTRLLMQKHMCFSNSTLACFRGIKGKC